MPWLDPCLPRPGMFPPDRSVNGKLRMWSGQKLGVGRSRDPVHQPGEHVVVPWKLLLLPSVLGSLVLGVLDRLVITADGQQGIEDRKIFNTNLYSKQNTGHEWTKALTDAERRALIEYLKTL